MKKRLNIQFLAIIAGLLVIGTVGLFVIHRIQVRRNIDGLARLARERVAEGKAAEAIELYERYLAFHPQDREATAEWGDLLLAQAEAPTASGRDLGRAAAGMEKAVNSNPGDAARRLKLAEFLLKNGRFEDALDHVQLLRKNLTAAENPLAAHPSETPKTLADMIPGRVEEKRIDLSTNQEAAHLALMAAKAHARLGNFEESAGLASDLVGFNLEKREFDPEWKTLPECGEAYELLAALLEQRLKDPTAADRVMKQWIKTLPADGNARLAAAQWSLGHGDAAAAEQYVATAAEMLPDDANVLFTSFQIALSEKKYDRAATIIQDAQGRFPDDERVLRARALLLLQQENTDEAVKVLEAGVERSAKPEQLLVMLCDVLIQTNRLDDAAKKIDQLREIAGAKSKPVMLFDVRLLMARSRWLEAKQKLESMRDNVGDSSDLLRQIDLMLAQCFRNLGQFDEQLEVDRRVGSEDTKSFTGKARIAASLAASGRTDEALAEYDAIIASVPQESIATMPQVWGPLLQLRAGKQLNRKELDRDWSSVDALLGLLLRSDAIADDDKAILEAKVRFQKGKVTSAIEAMEAALQKTPGNQRLAASFVGMLLEANQVDRASEALAALPASDETRVERLLLEARLIEKQKKEDATEQLARIEKEALALPAPQAQEVLAVLASIHAAGGRQAETERLWKQMLEANPGDLRILLALFGMAREQQDLDKAARYAEEIGQSSDSESAQAKTAQAALLLLQVAVSQQARTEGPKLSAEESGKLDKAYDMLVDAENDRPDWLQTQQLFADIERLRGKPAAAIERLQKALTAGTRNPAVVKQLANLLYAAGRLDEAARTVDMLNASDLSGMERLSADRAASEGKFAEALALAQKIVSPESKNVGELVWLAELYTRAGQGKQAEELFARVLELSPDQPVAWLAVASGQVQAGNREGAGQTASRAREVLSSPQRELVSAQIREMLGEVDVAAENYATAVAAAPDDPGVARQRAEFLIRRGQSKLAQEELERMIGQGGAASTPQKTWARRTLAGLAAENGSYKEMWKARALLKPAAGDGEDIRRQNQGLEVALLAARPEPASWLAALDLADTMRMQGPLPSNLRLLLSQILEKLDRWQEARTELIDLAGAPNAAVQLQAFVTERLLAHGEIASAKTALEKLQATDPDSPATLAIEARVALADGDRAAAVAVARRLMPTADGPPQRNEQLAATAALMEELTFEKAAEQVFNRYAEQSPAGIVERAKFLARQKRVDEALTRLGEGWGKLPPAQIIQVALQLVQGEGRPANPDLVAALEALIDRARQENPGSNVVLMTEAGAKELLEQREEAMRIYRSLLEGDRLPPMQAALISNNLAYNLLANPSPSDVDEAKKLIDSAIVELGPNPELLDTRALVWLAAGDPQKAIADLKETLVLPTAQKQLHLAVAYLVSKNSPNARIAFEKAAKLGLDPAKLDPQDRAILEKLEAALGKRNR